MGVRFDGNFLTLHDPIRPRIYIGIKGFCLGQARAGNGMGVRSALTLNQ